VEGCVLFRVSGQVGGEYSLYTSSYLLDIVRKDWWQEILDFVGVNREQLPELCEPGEIIGSIDPAVGQDLGLNPETLVVTGTMDQTAAMIGAGNITDGVVTETTDADPGNVRHDRCISYGAEQQSGGPVPCDPREILTHRLVPGWRDDLQMVQR